LLAWAAAERADVVLVIASGHLSNPCKDFLKQYETTNRPPFRYVRHVRRGDRLMADGAGQRRCGVTYAARLA
jgi:hypothetical protein